MISRTQPLGLPVTAGPSSVNTEGPSLSYSVDFADPTTALHSTSDEDNSDVSSIRSLSPLQMFFDSSMCPADPTAIVQYIKMIRSTFLQNYKPEDDFYKVLKCFLTKLNVCLPDISSPDGAKQVSIAFTQLFDLIDRHSTNIYDFANNMMFFCFVMRYSLKANNLVKKYCVRLDTDDNTVVITKVDFMAKPSHKRKNRSPEPEIELKNKFSCLSATEDDDIDSNVDCSESVNSDKLSVANDNESVDMDFSYNNSNGNTTTANNDTLSNSNGSNVSNVQGDKQQKTYRYNLYFELVKDWETKFDELMKNNPSLDANLHRNTLIRLTTTNSDHFRAAQRFLEDNNIPARSIDPTSLKPLKYLIRGLPVGTPLGDIQDALQEEGIEVIRTAALTNRKTKQKLPLHMVCIRPSPNVKKLKNITKIGYLRITWEDFKTKGYSQCYNCMTFGHSSHSCKLTTRCLKCAANHKTSDCELPKEGATLKCANCGLDHAANYKGCRFHPANKIKKNSTGRTFNPAPPPSQNPWIQRLKSARPESTSSQVPRELNETRPKEVASSLQASINTPTSSRPPQSNNTAGTSAYQNQEQHRNTTRVPNRAQESTSGSKGNKSSSGTSDLLELLKQAKEWLDFLRNLNIMEVVKGIRDIFNADDEPLSKMYNAFSLIAEVVSKIKS